MWQPSHLHEVVRTPLCSPVLLGLNLGGINASNPMNLLKARQLGGTSTVANGTAAQGAYYNFHWIKFPGAVLTDLLTNTVCAPQGSMDMDFAYLSEIDPTMQNDLLANYTHPESKIFSQMAAQAACMADSVKVAAGRPIHRAFWCAGSWGSLYPYTGHSHAQTTFESQMLTSARGLAAMHRRGLAKKTIGNKAVCNGRYWFTMPREQYQFQNLWPRAVRSAEWIGTTEYKSGWGLSRVVPASGENRVVMEWQFKECCITAW
jgi:conjugal transfer pilus assembly protein TraU